MNENILTIVLGVPSGIFTALFIWLFFVFYEKQLRPWFQDIVYKGVEIKGLWECDKIDSNIPNQKGTLVNYVLNINTQQGHIVKGEFSQRFIKSNSERYGTFKAEGYVIDGIVILTLMPENRSKSTFGTVVLDIRSASSALEGIFTYKGAINNEVTHDRVALIKKN